MSWIDEPNGGGGTAAATPAVTPAVPSQPVQPARCTAPGTTRATIDRNAVHVWLQAVDQLATDCSDVAPLEQSIRDRLQTLFNDVRRVRRQTDRAARAIQVSWTTDISAEPVGRQDVVIYFSNFYAPRQAGSTRQAVGNTSVVKRYLEQRRRALSGDPALADGYRALRDRFFDASGPPEAGLCVPDTDGTQPANGTSVSEVFIDVLWNADPVPAGATNREQILRNELGFHMAGMAFHEAMHNKINPYQAQGWDMHGISGGGLARLNFPWNQQATTADLDWMSRHMYRFRQQYILPSAAAPASGQPSGQAAGQPSGQPAGQGAGQPAPAASTTSLYSDGLEDL